MFFSYPGQELYTKVIRHHDLLGGLGTMGKAERGESTASDQRDHY